MTRSPTNIVDRFQRVHDYLRISLTERCNLRCFYCMPEEGIQLREKSKFMTSEELLIIAKTFVELGVKKIRLTGGEPLIKKDANHIIEELGKMPIELSITTNAVIVDRFIHVFKKAGIQSVNVSLDSLNTDNLDKITRRSFGKRIIENIDLLIREGFDVKINAVIIKGVNDDEIVPFVKWTQHKNISIRFIEFMPFDGNKWNLDKLVSHQEILQTINNYFAKENVKPIVLKPSDTAKNYQLMGALGIFGVVSTITNPFCDSCNRMRLTADGKLKNCLFSVSESDLLSQLRQGKDFINTIQKTILSKKKARSGIISFDDKRAERVFLKNRSMTSIGG